MAKRTIEALDVGVDAIVVDDSGSTSAPLGLVPAAVTPSAIDASTAPLPAPTQPLVDAHSDSTAALTAASASASATAAVASQAAMPQDAMSINDGSATKRQKKGNIFLTNEQRQALCIRAATEKATQTQLCFWAKDAFGLNGPLNQSTVSRILAEKDKYIAIEGSTLAQKRKTHVEHPALEAALSHWLLIASHTAQRIQGDLIKDKGRAFARMLGIESKISFSNGWLTGFKKRHAMILANDTTAAAAGPSGATSNANASAAVTATTPDNGLWQLQQVVQAYSPRDVFCVDETGLFFAMMPEKAQRRGSSSSSNAKSAAAAGASSSSTTTVGGSVGTTTPVAKMPKDKLTLLLAVNADGSERLDPVFIGRSKHLARTSPGVAGIATPKHEQQLQGQGVTIDADKPFHYYYSARPWLNAVVFQRWLNTLNSQMKIANRHVLLLLDDAPAHVLRGLKLTNIRVLGLEGRTASVVTQLFDNGVTLAFKRRYRKRQMVHALDRLEAGDSDIYSIDEVQAMKWCRAAWLDVPNDVVATSWLQSRLFGEPLGPQSNDNTVAASAEDELDQTLKDIAYRLPLKRVMALKELLSPPDESDDLHFVGTTEADFLAVQDELPSFQASSSSTSNSSYSSDSVASSGAVDSTAVPNAFDCVQGVVVGSTGNGAAAAAPGDSVAADVRVDATAALQPTAVSTGRAANSDAPREDAQLPDDDLLLYVQKLVPNLERLGCDERTIEALRTVRQALKQRLSKSKTSSSAAGSITML